MKSYKITMTPIDMGVNFVRKSIDLPDTNGGPDIGDIGGIIKLLNATIKSYNQLVISNTDPENPNLARLRLVGGVMIRVPHKTLYQQIIEPSYQEARELGYRGTLDRWRELLQETTESPQLSSP